MLPAQGTGREGHWLGGRQLPHEDGELQPVRQNVQRIAEPLVAHVADVGAGNVVRLVDSLVTLRCFIPGCGENVVGHPHLDVVRFTGEDGQRFILRLPSEAGDGAVVAAPVRHAADAHRRTQRRRRRRVADDGRVLNRLDQSEAKQLQRDAERQVAVAVLRFEIRLGKNRGGAPRRTDIASSDHREQRMHAAVRRPVRIFLEAHLADGTVSGFRAS